MKMSIELTFKLRSSSAYTILEFEPKGLDGFLNQLIVRWILENGWKTKILITNLPKYLTSHA